jgi:hypothetical protein
MKHDNNCNTSSCVKLYAVGKKALSSKILVINVLVSFQASKAQLSQRKRLFSRVSAETRLSHVPKQGPSTYSSHYLNFLVTYSYVVASICSRIHLISEKYK